MKYFVWLGLSAAVSFGISLFFSGDTAKVVFTLLTFMFLCAMFVTNKVVESNNLLSNNQKKIYELLEEVQRSIK